MHHLIGMGEVFPGSCVLPLIGRGVEIPGCFAHHLIGMGELSPGSCVLPFVGAGMVMGRGEPRKLCASIDWDSEGAGCMFPVRRCERLKF